MGAERTRGVHEHSRYESATGGSLPVPGCRELDTAVSRRGGSSPELLREALQIGATTGSCPRNSSAADNCSCCESAGIP